MILKDCTTYTTDTTNNFQRLYHICGICGIYTTDTTKNFPRLYAAADRLLGITWYFWAFIVVLAVIFISE